MSADEAALARSAALKALHRPLRKWFRLLSAEETKAFQLDELDLEKHPFPMFWNELGEWKYLKKVQKMYEGATSPKEDGAETAHRTSAAAAAAGDAAGDAAADAAAPDRAPSAADDGTSADAADAHTGGTMATGGGRKKRKSRFASASAPPPSSSADSAEPSEPAAAPKRRRKSRFSATTNGDDSATPNAAAASSSAAATADAAAPAGATRKRRSRFTAPTLTPAQRQLTILHARLADLHTQLLHVAGAAAAAEQADPSLADAVKPEYDSNGKRTNRLVDRMRADLHARRKRTLRDMVKVNPACKAQLLQQGCHPDDFLIIKRMFIPTEDFPGYNFFGLIIGPRGKTQKEMEAKAGVKISIRGKGSVKEGARGRRSTKPEPGNDLPLHVKITGESEEGIAIATKLIEPLLNPCDDADNAHKQAQLRELALINGTLRTDVYCQICGEKGHRQFECPKRHNHKAGGGVVSAGVRCAICGDTSHVTADCKLTREEVAAGARERESDFQGFLADLGDEGAQRQVERLNSVGGAGAGSGARHRHSHHDPQHRGHDHGGGGAAEPSRNLNKGGVVEILGGGGGGAPLPPPLSAIGNGSGGGGGGGGGGVGYAGLEQGRIQQKPRRINTTIEVLGGGGGGGGSGGGVSSSSGPPPAATADDAAADHGMGGSSHAATAQPPMPGSLPPSSLPGPPPAMQPRQSQPPPPQQQWGRGPPLPLHHQQQQQQQQQRPPSLMAGQHGHGGRGMGGGGPGPGMGRGRAMVMPAWMQQQQYQQHRVPPPLQPGPPPPLQFNRPGYGAAGAGGANWMDMRATVVPQGDDFD
jgi:splicing factor 1